MNIYISKRVTKISFFDKIVTFVGEHPVSIENIGLSYIVNCICEGRTNLECIAQDLSVRFNLSDDISNIKKMILSCTSDKIIEEFFTCDINEANLSPKVQGSFGKKYPEILHIELTGVCNFFCSHCYKNASCDGKSIKYEILKNKIYDTMKGIIPVIHLTGGEPTLHKQFCEIVDMFNDGYDLQLTTNGSRIVLYPIEVFKKFKSIDISLYGLSAEEYKVNTGNSDAYELVKTGCEMLSAAGINFRVTLVINNENWKEMRDYVMYALEVGAKEIAFGVPTSSGRLLNNNSGKWYLTNETKKIIYKEFRNIREEYRDRIYIENWSRSVYYDMWKSYPIDDSLRCGAGKNNWWVSEELNFRPCSFLPNEYMCLDYDKWCYYINNEQKLDWSNARNSLELFAANHDLDITDLCPIFRK